MIRNIALSVAAAASLAGAASGAAQAQQYPGYDRPPYRHVAYGPEIGRYQVRGWVDSFDRFDMKLRADGRDVPVHLHQGTIILPTGLTLQPGMLISIDGHWSDERFHADRIVLVR